MHKKLSCLNGRAKRKQDVRVADRYFLFKLVTWTTKQDLRVVDKYFLIKLVTRTRNEIVNTYQSRSGKNQINFFCLYNQNTEKMRECVTRDEGRVEGGSNKPKVWNPKMCDLCEVTCQGSRKKSPGTCATVRSVPSLLHWLANWPREEAGTTTCFSSPHRAMDKYIGKIKKGASFPFWPWQD